MKPSPALDLFCAVVDNYGDIGVCWRLARQLTSEQGYAVRLWVDDLASFARLCPEVDVRLDSQRVSGVDIRLWHRNFPEVEPGEVVIEAFACQLPDTFIAALARRPRPPIWINLEYLSAEAWVEGCHGLPSPQQGTGLLKYFFFPGFTDKTGGLILERGLLAQRAAFQADEAAQAEFWRRLGLPDRRPTETRISLFSYANTSTLDLLEAWRDGTAPVTCLIPEGTAAATLAAAELGMPTSAGNRATRQQLTIHILPFLPQEDYDRLLWACDLNFVRGEDSFVRAQWAARPFVWHIYPQDEDTHHIKLEAFLARHLSSFPQDAATAMRAFWHAWNGVGDKNVAAAWAAFRAELPVLSRAAPHWARQLAVPGDLAGNLEKFIKSRL